MLQKVTKSVVEQIQKIFPSASEKALKRYWPMVHLVNALEPKISQLTDQELQQKTVAFREKLKNGATLEDIKLEAFAVAREASKRVLGMRPYDVQVLGGLVLHDGKIAEMKTGEGKTLVATMPTYLNALTSKGVHVVTVNDYLARRDAEWMGQLYRWLGLTTGVIVNGLNDEERQKAYQSDITYGQNNEFGFDYLRDNMKPTLDAYVQRELNFAIIDEVDSILIDEARTPLIISGPAEKADELYHKVDEIMPKLKKDIHYNVDEKSHSATLTDTGVDQVEKLLSIDHLYDPSNLIVLHHVNNALKAHTLYRRDVHYLVIDGEVMIIDEHTGRLMEGRRWSDGLHQAIEAKENVSIRPENQTLATISFQNYFRLYNKLAGMTGTAKTEEEEFQKIYNLQVVTIPTNHPLIREDLADLIYRSERGKFKACVDQIKACHAKGQPVLVGTISVEKSEIIHRLLNKEKIPHEVLNAKQHHKEASIVAQAGRFGQVTVATNMAGRGTDIILGGNAEYWGQAKIEQLGIAVRYTQEWEKIEDFVKKICIKKENEARLMREKDELLSQIPETFIDEIAKTRDQFAQEKAKVLQAGGLFILGTERHESRRIDNQLRGRAGRQGDPGMSRFFLSLDDDLMRIFAKDAMIALMDRIGMNDEMPIDSPMVSRAIEGAQRRVEGQNFDYRKHLLEYDDVMNQQRKTLYKFRRQLLEADDAKLNEIFLDALEDSVSNLVDRHCPAAVSQGKWDISALEDAIKLQYQMEIKLDDLHRSRDLYLRRIYFTLEKAYTRKKEEFEQMFKGAMSQIQVDLFLKHIDEYWKQHLQTMDQLRSGIGLRGYSQKDPKKEYQKEGFHLFSLLLVTIKVNVVRMIMLIEIDRRSDDDKRQEEEALKRLLEERQRQAKMLAKQVPQSKENIASTGPSLAKQVISNPNKGPSIDDILLPLDGDDDVEVVLKEAHVDQVKSVHSTQSQSKPQSQGKPQNQKANQSKKKKR
jgi:preprotein translocase subunit SecA